MEVISIDKAEDKEREWKKSKWGKFSASEIDVLTVGGTGGKLFGEGATTYIEKVAREAYTIYSDDENVETPAMRKGKIKEPEAYAHYCRLVGFGKMEYYGGGNPYFQQYCDDSGSSPDAIAWKDKIEKLVSFGAEFKCPVSKTHMFYLRNIKDQFDLRKHDRTYYGQIQFNLLTFGADLWHWTSYNEYYPFKDQMLIIEVLPDRQYLDGLQMRLKQAVKDKYKIIEELKNR